MPGNNTQNDCLSKSEDISTETLDTKKYLVSYIKRGNL